MANVVAGVMLILFLILFVGFAVFVFSEMDRARPTLSHTTTVSGAPRIALGAAWEA